MYLLQIKNLHFAFPKSTKQLATKKNSYNFKIEVLQAIISAHNKTRYRKLKKYKGSQVLEIKKSFLNNFWIKEKSKLKLQTIQN